MTPEERASRLTANRARAREEMRKLSTNPEMARGVIGTVVLDMIQKRETVSEDAIVLALEGIVSGAKPIDGMSEILAKGAITVIAGLRD